MDFEAIRLNGWRQGSVFPADATKELGSELRLEIADQQRLVLVSHSCDVLHSGDSEPLADVYSARLLGTTADGTYTHGKNPRILHLALAIRDDETPAYCEFRAGDRGLIDRAKLASYVPDDSIFLPDSSLYILQQWLAGRYIRAALPDAFNTRISEAWKKDILKVLKSRGRELGAVYVALKPWSEVDEGDSYEVHLLGAMPPHTYAISAKREEVGGVMSDIAEILNGCDGVSVIEYETRPYDQITLDDAEYFVRLNVEHLSLRENPRGLVAP